MTDWLEQAREGCNYRCDPKTGLVQLSVYPIDIGPCSNEVDHQRTATQMQEAAEAERARCIAVVEALLPELEAERYTGASLRAQGARDAVKALRRQDGP